MARKSLIIASNRRKKAVLKDIQAGKKPSYPTRVYNRCGQCGKVRAYMRRFGICRICFRELANDGQIMGVRKSSW